MESLKEFLVNKGYRYIDGEVRYRPCQIPIKKARFKYLTEQYRVDESDEWVMFHYPNHFLICSPADKCCVLDAEYIVSNSEQTEDDSIYAVISGFGINALKIDSDDGFDIVYSLVKNLL